MLHTFSALGLSKLSSTPINARSPKNPALILRMAFLHTHQRGEQDEGSHDRTRQDHQEDNAWRRLAEAQALKSPAEGLAKPQRQPTGKRGDRNGQPGRSARTRAPRSPPGRRTIPNQGPGRRPGPSTADLRGRRAACERPAPARRSQRPRGLQPASASTGGAHGHWPQPGPRSAPAAPRRWRRAGCGRW